MNNVPIGWSFKRVQDMGRVITGSTPPMSDKDNYGNEFCWATAQDFKSKYIDDTVVKLSSKGKTLSRVLPAGSVLVTCIASIGLNAIAKTEMATNQQINAIIPNDDFCSDFLYYLFCYNTDKLKQYAGSGGILILSKGEFEKIRFMLPPIKEQEKIAEVLGTWDRAIEELTGLIAEKKELKRGLMQRLLTGTQRLPGFTKPWKKIKLSDVLEECTETTTINNQYDILTSSRRGIFKQEDYFDKQVASQDNIGYKIIHNGDFTYRAMTDDDKFCFNQLTDLEIGIVSPAYAVFQTKKIPGNILKFILNSGRFGYELLKEAQGGTRKSLKYNSLIKLQIYVPDDEKEMDKLSDCLFVADSEIDLLNQQLDLLKEQKHGLMQKLLTGEIRVKVDME